MFRSWCPLLYLLLFTLTATAASRDPGTPEGLQPWRNWVLYNHPDIHCPFLYNNKARHCYWITALDIRIQNDKLRFSQDVSAYRDTWITLPGDHRYWPTGIRAAGSTLVVREHRQSPQVYLSAGRYRIQGEIDWQAMPQSLTIPEQTGLISLTINGSLVPQPDIEERQLWLRPAGEKGAKTQGDSVELKVFRHLKDSMPLEVTTRLVLDISGRERELLIGRALLEDFVPMELDSPLPARIEPEGQLRIQVKPGHWQINLKARSPADRAPPQTLGFSVLSEQWPEREIWVFESQPRLRLVQPGGAENIDPQQTDLPAEWQRFPAYLMTPTSTLELKQQHRGDPTPAANKLALNQDIWLDFDGGGFTLLSRINGTMHSNWRLDAQPDYTLGRVALNGIPQLITRLPDGGTGVEIRHRQIKLLAVSRHRHLNHLVQPARLSATGWQEDFQQVNTTLHLPPGWSLFSASGADRVHPSWVSRWSLWDLFLVLIIAAAVSRLCGHGSGLLALVTLVLIYHRPQAPLFIWLNLAAVLALMPVVSGRFKQGLGYYQKLSFTALVLLLVPFAVDQIRTAIYPQLEHPWHSQAAMQRFEPELPAPAVSSTVIEGTAVESMQATTMDESTEEAASADDMRLRKLTQSRATSFKRPAAVPSQSLASLYDPSASTQTGPGIPQWRWNQVSMNWNGPVKAAETVTLQLIPPIVNRLGNLLAVVLVLALTLRLIRHSLCPPKSTPGATISKSNPASLLPLATAGLLASLLIPGPTAHADVMIDSDLLKSLEQRLTEPAPCLPHCASIETMALEIARDNTLQLKLTVNALADIALPLPVPGRDWQPRAVSLNGAAAPLAFRRGQLLVALPEGRHRLTISGSLTGVEQLSLPLPVVAHNVSARAPGWQVSGIERGYAPHSLQLRRNIDTGDQQSSRLLPDPPPVFVTVHREIRLGLDWSVETRVERITPASGAIALTLPLLPGESLISENVTLTDAGVEVNLAPQQQSLHWNSVLKKSASLTLTAPRQDQWVEVWSLSMAPVWHLQTSGIAPLKPDPSSVDRQPQWRPWPGETLTLTIRRPEAVEGRYLSIDSVALGYNLGQRSSNASLTFKLRSSLGQSVDLPLPPGARLQKYSIDGHPQPITRETGSVTIAVHPGSQQISLAWQSDTGIDTRITTPILTFPAPASNNSITVTLPRDRWPLLMGGPALGPAVLFWGWLLVIAIAAAILGFSRLTPLKTHHWLLLGIGMSTANLFIPLIIVAWLLTLAKRGRLTRLPSPRAFKWMQLGLFALSLIALAVLLGTIPYGLLAAPDMHVLGNQSNAYSLHWYQDRTSGELPSAWVVSLPMWNYRLAMLLWSLWLAFAMLKWIRWGWQQLSHGGLWQLAKTGVTAGEVTPEEPNKKSNEVANDKPHKHIPDEKT